MSSVFLCIVMPVTGNGIGILIILPKRTAEYVNKPELDGLDKFFNHNLSLFSSQRCQLMFRDRLKARFRRHTVVDFKHVHVLHLRTTCIIMHSVTKTVHDAKAGGQFGVKISF